MKSAVNTLAASGLTTAVPPAANLSANACGAVRRAWAECAKAGSPCFSTPQAALLTGSYIQPLAAQCEVAAIAQEVALVSVRSHNTGPYLLGPKLLNAVLKAVTVAESQRQSVTIQASLAAIRAAAASYPAPAVDLAAGALASSPANCSCTSLASAGLLVTGPAAWTGCAYRPPWDADASRNTYWSCNAADMLLRFPEALLRPTPGGLYDGILALPGSSARFNFSGAVGPSGAPLAGATLADVLLSTENYFLPLSGGKVDWSNVRAGIFNLPYSQYFAQCAPTSCSYTVTEKPNAATALTTALGTLSGVQMIIYMLVGMALGQLIDAGWGRRCCCCCCRRQAAKAEATAEPAGSRHVSEGSCHGEGGKAALDFIDALEV